MGRIERRDFLLSAGALLAAPLAAEAQQTGKVYRVGFIYTAPPQQVVHLAAALEEGLWELGYVEGRNIVLERRSAGGDQERLPALAGELVRLKVDVIVTGSNPVIAAVKKSTATVPVVMAVSRDPVGAGFIASLARPGGNITGLANDPTPEILGKSLDLLKEAVPGMSRVALLWNPLPPGASVYKDAAERAARRMGASFHPIEVRGRSDFEAAFATMRRERVDGIVVAQDPIFFGPRQELAVLALRNHLPTVYALREYAEAGGLMAYGPNIAYQFRRAAVYVDKILKGANPANLPVEQATKFELVINQKTAKALGITIAKDMLLRADEVIQ